MGEHENVSGRAVPSVREASGFSKVQTLNQQTQGLDGCAWPDCRDVAFRPAYIRGIRVEQRVGVLCLTHADQVADAVLEQRVQIADFMHHGFTEESARIKARRESNERQAELDRQHRRDQPGWVYYILIGDRIKIGFSSDVRKRMRAYPSGSELLAVEPGTFDLEKQRHAEFRQFLLEGREWFRPDVELVQHISDVVDLHGKPHRFAHRYRKPGDRQTLKPAS